MIRKGIKVENKDCKLIYIADNLTCSLHRKKSDVIHFLTAHILIINAQGFISRRAKKKVVGLKGSSYHNQKVFDITNANEQIKIFFMILFTFEKHLKENNSETILKASTQ